MGKRPDHIKPPAHWTKSEPPPQPDPLDAPPAAEDGLSPVRYGDWERKGIAVDF